MSGRPFSVRARAGGLASLVVIAALLLGSCANDTDSQGSGEPTVDAPSSQEGSPASTSGDPAEAEEPKAESPKSDGGAPPEDPSVSADDEITTDVGGVAYPGPISDPVAVDETADFGEGVTARLLGVADTEVEAVLPGEANGPGAAITVEVKNGSGGPVDLGEITVDLVVADGTSATLITSAQDEEIGGEVAAGETSSATYVFSVPADARTNAQLFINYSSAPRAVVFAGSFTS